MKPEKAFYSQLEGFRGMAILLVLISHFIIVPFFPKLLFLKLGAWGVNLFFVLSGFLITEILLKEIYSLKEKPAILKRFYFNRTLRIFPIYYLCILLLAFFKGQHSEESLPYTLTYTYNIGRIWFHSDAPVLMHLWSLCVEEQFYLIWPVLLIYTARKYHKQVIIGIIVVAIITKAVYFILKGHSYLDFNMAFTPTSFDALGFGALLAYLKLNHLARLQNILRNYAVPVVIAVVFWATVYFTKEDHWFYQVFARLFFGATGFYLVGIGALSFNTVYGKIMSNKLLKFIGKISYGIYIYHWIIYVLLAEWFYEAWKGLGFSMLPALRYQGWLAGFVFFTILTVIVSTVSFYLIERPILRFKRVIAR